jgi:hypothetical protein
VNGNKKLSWIKWKVVCIDKKKSGLGVRDLEAMNTSLLLKWRWRLLNRDDSPLWKEVLVAKYGINIVNNVRLSLEVPPYFASLWWKDLCDLDDWGDNSNWLGDVVLRSLGNDRHTRFWRDVWIGDAPLSLLFPRLFSISLQKEASVEELLKVEGGRRWWDFRWRHNLFQWEVEKVDLLVDRLVNVSLSSREDGWRWAPNPDEGFSVKSAYDVLMEGVDRPLLNAFDLSLFSRLWESPAPSKVVAFSWQLFYNRLPTKDNLARRGVLQQDAGRNCVWCDQDPESANHLFLHCRTAHKVWYEIFKWLGLVVVMPPNILSLFACVSDAARSNKVRSGFLLVWHTVLWSLWRARNDDIFNGVKKGVVDTVEDIKVLSWKWSVDRLKISPCLFYEWIWDPGDCFLR